MGAREWVPWECDAVPSTGEFCPHYRGAGCAGRADLTLTARQGGYRHGDAPKCPGVALRQMMEVDAAREAQQTHPTLPPLASDAWTDGAPGLAAVSMS